MHPPNSGSAKYCWLYRPLQFKSNPVLNGNIDAKYVSYVRGLFLGCFLVAQPDKMDLQVKGNYQGIYQGIYQGLSMIACLYNKQYLAEPELRCIVQQKTSYRRYCMLKCCFLKIIMTNKRVVYVSFYTIFGLVLGIFILRGVLLVSRYGITASGLKCVQDLNQTTAVATKLNHEYIFTTIVYGILSILRILEYSLLAKQFYHFLFNQIVVDVSAFFEKRSHRFLYLFCFVIVLLPYFFLGLTIPALGIYQEIEYSDRLVQCYHHYYEIYVAYCVTNFFRYMSAFTVRIMMIYTALSLSKIWFPDHDGPPLHTSVGLGKCENIEASLKASPKNAGPLANNPDVANNPTPVADNPDVANNALLLDGAPKKILEDWKMVSSDFQVLSKRYTEIGKQVQVIQDLFQPWFVVPWIVYLIASSLKTYNVLRPWNADGDGDTPLSSIPHIHYLLYNINQFITLIIPYLCAKKINTYHQKYFKIMRDHQLKKFEDDPSRLSLARQLMLDRKNLNDFVPRIIGTSITISIGNPLFVIILLVGIFLSVSESLLER